MHRFCVQFPCFAKKKVNAKSTQIDGKEQQSCTAKNRITISIPIRYINIVVHQSNRETIITKNLVSEFQEKLQNHFLFVKYLKDYCKGTIPVSI